MRLQKFLSDMGYCSRRQAEELVQAGRISINGKTAILGDKVTQDDLISVDGQQLQRTSTPAKKVVAFFKPKGVECTLSQIDGVNTLLDFDFGPDRLFPIGGLDRDSHGLLLLTNDGELGNRLAHPTIEHEEEYLVVAKDRLTNGPIAHLPQFLPHEKTTATIYEVELLANSILRVVLHEGRNRQLSEICDAAGITILDLQRIRIGSVKLGKLQPGEWELLDDAGFKALKQEHVTRKSQRRIVSGPRK